MTAHPIDTEALRRLADAATPGPWRAALLAGGTEYEDGSSSYRGGIYPVGHGQAPVMLTNSVDRRDAEFIAAARTAVPALLDALAAAAGRAIRAEAQSEARRIDIAYWTARAQMMGRKRDAGLRDLAHVQKERDNALARIKAVRDVLDSIDTSTEPALHDGFADIRRALEG